MANQGAKKRLEENARKLKNLRIAMLAGLVSYFLIRLVLFGGYKSTLQLVGFGFTLLVEGFTYMMISGFAQPIYDNNGELIDGGADLSMGGMCGYYHDLFYVSVFVQVTQSISIYFWLAYLAVPAYAFFLLYKHVLGPYFSSDKQKEPVIDDATRKKLERADKRSERRRVKSGNFR